jgi:phosphopantothenoylcysteine synthetase/decarboxylase
MRIAITSGPTREPIDDVRYVSNVSTGRLGVAVAEAFLAAGHDVLFLRGEGSLAPAEREGLEVVTFGSAASLLALLEKRLTRDGGAPVAWIHAAAVADYAPAPVAGKLKSDRDELVLRMLPTPKIGDRIRARRDDLTIVMFKLESGIARDELERRARATLERAGADAIVANLLAEVGAEHRALLLRRDGTRRELASREAIAAALVEEVTRLVAARAGSSSR